MKKAFWLILIGISLIFSVSAQSNFGNFSGNWKPVKSSFAKQIPNTIMTLDISQTGDEIKFEKRIKNSNTNEEWGGTILFKNNRTIISNPVGRFGGIEKRNIYSLNPKKIRIDTKFVNTYNQNKPDDSIIEIWTLSDDAKTLTVEINYNNHFSKIIFTKI